ncbi:hypothetical protein S245_008962 [Arachis hypogaea]
MHPSLYNIFPPSFTVVSTVTNFQPPTLLYPFQSTNSRDTDEILKLLKSPQHHQSDSGTNKKASKQTSVRDKKICTAKRRIVWNSHLSQNKGGVNAASIKDNFSKKKKLHQEPHINL